MGKPLVTLSAGDILLGIRAYKKLSGYHTYEQMYNKHKEYGYAKTIKHNYNNTFGKNFFAKPLERSIDVAVVPVYHKKIRRKMKKKFGSIKDPFDIVRVTP